MRAKEVIGKRIVEVQQSFQHCAAGTFKTLDALVLDDGTRLLPQVHESDHDYGVTLVVNKTGRKEALRLERIAEQRRALEGEVVKKRGPKAQAVYDYWYDTGGQE